MKAAMTVGELSKMIEGMDAGAPVVVGIIEGGMYDAAYVDQMVIGDTPTLHIVCHERPRAWEGEQPSPNSDGTASLEYDPDQDGPP